MLFNGDTLFKEVWIMNRHEFIVCTLVKTGFRVSLKGFAQFCMCIEMYLDGGSPTIESIYGKVALRTACTASAVEKNLRRLFLSSDACRAVGKLYGIDYTDCGNKQIIAMFANYISMNSPKYSANCAERFSDVKRMAEG